MFGKDLVDLWLTSGKSLEIASKTVESIRIIIKNIVFMNIHTQGRLLAKYELITPNGLRDGAIQRLRWLRFPYIAGFVTLILSGVPNLRFSLTCYKVYEPTLAIMNDSAIMAENFKRSNALRLWKLISPEADIFGFIRMFSDSFAMQKKHIAKCRFEHKIHTFVTAKPKGLRPAKNLLVDLDERST